jgi:IS5 family transposase
VKLSNSEVMTICIAYHQSGYKNLKAFYLNYVIKYLSRQFPKLVSYNRFIELMQQNMQLLAGYLVSRFEDATGISYIDSTPIQVCKPKRMSRNKVFKETASKAKSTIGWFFGFKLHLIVNEQGGLLAVKFTKANLDDRKPVLDMVKNIFGKLYGDKGYISKELTAELQDKGINLITGLKKNMKNKLLTIRDKILLRKRSIIETINDQLKNISDIEHSRHRSLCNFIVNLLCGLIAYTHQPKKPTIRGLDGLELAIN